MGWGYFLLSRSLKNNILKILRKPATLIGYLVFIALMFFNVMNMDKNMPSIRSNYPKLIYLMIIIVLGYLSIVIPLYKGTKAFSLRFLEADGNYLMAGPVKPLTLIWYAQFKQSILIILMSSVMFIQIPTLRNSVGLSEQGIALFILGYLVLSIVPMVVCLCAFTLGLVHEAYKTSIRYATLMIGGAGVIILSTQVLLGNSLFEGLENGLTSKTWVLVPLLGWCYTIFVASLKGVMTVEAVISLVLLAATLIISLWIIAKKIDVQFYEEALNTAQRLETMKQGMKDGKSKFELLRTGKKIKARKIANAFKRWGIWALIDKQALITRKKGVGIFDFQSLAVIVLIVVPNYYFQKNIMIAPYSLIISIGILTYALFFVQMIHNQSEDIDRHYLYLFPYSSFMKLIAISYWSFLKLLIDAGIGFLIVFFTTSFSLIECALAALFVALLGYLFYLVSILTMIIFGKTGTLPLRLFVRIFFYFVYLIVILIVMILIIQDHVQSRQWIALMAADCIMITMAAVMMIPTSIVVSKPEYNL